MATPVVDLGKELSCTTSIRTGRFVTGARLVAEAAYRRITTPRGMLRGGEEEANYGIDILGMLGSVASTSQARAAEARIRSELTKDERITKVEVGVVRTVAGPATTFTVTIRATTDVGPFDLVLSVNEVTTAILNIKAES